jgi:DNA polymerase elongation subunit (family B)
MSAFYTNCQIMGNNILYRGVENGKRVKRRIPYKPTLYTPAPGQKSNFKTLYGMPLKPIEFDSIGDLKEFKTQYEGVDNFQIFGDIRHDYAFISDTFRGDIDWDLTQVVLAYIDIEVGSENGFPEPEHASEPVTAITLHVGGRFWVFGQGDFETDRTDVTYYQAQDEKDLLRTFLSVWVDHAPDLVTGWNTNQFDFPYLINRMQRLFMGADGEDILKTLSPWNWIKDRTAHFHKKETAVYDIAGVAMIDYLDLYKKYGPGNKQESYTLNYIASVEIGEAKIDYSEHEDLYTLYKRDHQKFIEYNIRDVELVMKIEDKMRLLELAMTLAYDAKVNYEDVFMQVRMWDSIMYNHLKTKGIMVPPKKDSSKREQFIGAYVKDPDPGMYHWVASFDFQSLYPHLIMTFNLSPETLVEPSDYDDEIEAWFNDNHGRVNLDNMLSKRLDTSILQRKGMTVTPNGQLFRVTEQGFLAEIMDTMYQDRAQYKKLMTQAIREKESCTDPDKLNDITKRIARYNNLQQAKKVCLNSAFGAIGNPFFRFFDVRIAEAITLSAQLSIIWIQQELNRFINVYTGAKDGDYVIASDTDSVYVTFKTIVDKAYTPAKQAEMGPLAIIRSLDKLCEKIIGPNIDAFCQDLVTYTNAFDQRLIMKREALADKAIWTGKKHYMINVYNNEGVEYTKPKLKIVGMEAIKSTTPGICRATIKEAFEIIINKDERTLRAHVDAFRDKFMSSTVHDIAKPSGMNGLVDYDGGSEIYKKRTPIHTKGALVYNHWLEKLKLMKKYQAIKDGDKLKYVYLREPNPLQASVVSFTTVIPPEFDLTEYIDYNVMFEKTFLDQITQVTNVIGWKLEEVSSLEALFG